jgi:hypothetical protein
VAVPAAPTYGEPAPVEPTPARPDPLPGWAGPTSYAEQVPPQTPVFAPAPTFFPAEAEPAPNPPLPVRAGLATEPIGSVPRATILGLACSNGHLNDPSLAACATCGAPLASQPANLREGPRPPLGVLTLDDGSSYVLDIDYVLGREPQHDQQVLEGTARPLKITDSEGVVSRRHLRVALNGWDIQIIDLGSANGTYAQYPGESQLHQLSAHHPLVVRPGTQVTMGRRWFRIDPAPAAG